MILVLQTHTQLRKLGLQGAQAGWEFQNKQPEHSFLKGSLLFIRVGHRLALETLCKCRVPTNVTEHWG